MQEECHAPIDSKLLRRPEFLGKIIFLENYDMDLARHLIAGVDIWLNTPTRLAEASGTSGEKALMNGVLNFSVLDGWWYEGYCKDAGWALTDKSIYQNEQYQNQLDAEAIYYLLEHDILPAYYEHGDKEYSENWIKYIKNSIAQIAPRFTMKRQLDDYYEKLSTPFISAFSPDVPEASARRVGVFSQISTPAIRCLARSIS